MRTMEIDAQAVHDVLAGTYEHEGAAGEELDLQIGGLNVARIQAGRVVALACTHPSHGVRDEYRTFQRRLRRAARRSAPPCPQCGGHGWLDVDAPEAKQLKSMALLLGIYRGIRIN